jgi:clorobiocin biosynthesis protein CloN6
MLPEGCARTDSSSSVQGDGVPQDAGSGFPTVRADLLLVHPPAFFDFRQRPDIYFPYLSTSGDVPITPLYEYLPLGFRSLQHYLGVRGHDVRIVNLATVLLKFPKTDIRAFLKAVEVRLFGIDLHWMVHVQGSIEIAALLKSIHSNVPIIFGGISSTYYADELIRLGCVDMVMQGYDTHEPMAALMDVLKKHASLIGVPNLIWKDRSGQVVDNGLTHTPGAFACGVDWSKLPGEPERKSMPILEIVSTQNAGCTYNCGWCGGSRDAFRRIFKGPEAIARKPLDQILVEFDSMKHISNLNHYHFHSAGSYDEPRDRMQFLLDRVEESNFRSVSYEQFLLTPDDVLKAMVKANKRTTLSLSPQSHDVHISRLAGRGVFTAAELERWIRKALDFGITGVDIWYCVGMPEQDEQSVWETVEYSGRLLRLFKGERVVPLLCPMIPFLDPGSTFFERPQDHGYQVFYRTLEDHRLGMQRASIINRTNYQTKWLSRSDLVFVAYRAVRRLVVLKGELGLLPGSVAQSVVDKIDDALTWIRLVHEIDCIRDPIARRRELEAVGAEILARNDNVFFSGVANQAFPINREVGGRWFDELLQEPAVFLNQRAS